MIDLENKIAQLENQRLRLLLMNLVGFILWDGLRIVQLHWAELLSVPSKGVLIVVQLCGFVLWVLALWKVIQMSKKIKNEQLLLSILKNEWFAQNRTKSLLVGFSAVVVLQFLAIILGASGISMSGVMVADLSLFVAVVSILISFLLYQNAD